MRVRINIFLLFIVGFSNCTNSNVFEYEDRVLNYFHDVHNIALDDESIIVIFTGSCSTCQERTYRFVTEISSKAEFNHIAKYVVFPMKHVEYSSSYLNSEFEVIMDVDYKLNRYGLDFDKNLLVHFEKGQKVKYWQWMYMQYFFDIGAEYKIADL
jgi:hypothetical protein